jgi:FAD/FMN-containing dehydrogenase
MQPDQEKCALVREQYDSFFYRSDQYNGFMNSYGETCASSEDPLTSQCLLNPANVTASEPLATNASCGQGSLSRHYIEVANENDVVAAFAFARQTGHLLSIKNSGHDYLTRSSLKGSLGLWTRKLQDMRYTPEFVPAGCPTGTQAQSAVTVGAGVNLDQIYKFADDNNVTFMGGSSPTVGASGGFLMGGGHGLLSAQFGLAIDRALEFKIVTPDGVLRRANACQNSDLFWALRGGGGGTFGLVLESTSKVEPRMELNFALMALPQALTDTSNFTQILLDNALRWSDEGWGGPNSANSFAMANPFLSIDQARASLESLSKYVLSVGGTVSIERYPSFFAIYEQFIKPVDAVGIGAGFVTTNRMIPNSLVGSADGKSRIQQYLSRLQEAGLRPTIFQTTPTYYQARGHYTENSTSATSAWRDSVWMITTGRSWDWDASLAEKKDLVRLIGQVTEDSISLAPDTGAYSNEADQWTKDWRRSWFGDSNYARLLQIKKKYDPFGLLNCWRCVGWSERLAQKGKSFACMGGLDQHQLDEHQTYH